MEIEFIRHGQTDLNKTGRIQGSSVDAELNETGRNLAIESAKNFDESEFDRVFASPMKRAVETARIFTKDKKDIILDKRLMEFDYGEWDGKLLTEMKEQHPDAIDPWGKADSNYIKYAPHGESFAHLKERCAEFMTEIEEKYPNEKILVVAHGTLIRMMIAYLITDGNIDAIQTMDNCGAARVSIRGGIARLEFYNKLFA